MDRSIRIEPAWYHGQRRLFLKFAYDKKIFSIISGMNNSEYSIGNRCWHVSNNPETLRELFRLFRGLAHIDATAVFDRTKTEQVKRADSHDAQKTIAGCSARRSINIPDKRTLAAINQFSDWMRQMRYSERTIGTYSDALRIFLGFFHDTQFEKLENKDIIRFNSEYIIANRYSLAYQNQVINAVKLFYRKMHEKEIDVDKIERPRNQYKLPNVLSKEEVAVILSVLKNIKHKAMLSLIYSCGLRRSELLNLSLSDVDSKRNLLIIRSGKGFKDRVAPLSDKTIELLRSYYREYKPKAWLFEGWVAGQNYSEESLAHVLKKALILAKIKKPVSLHWLRHSYATHMLENGTDLRHIQEILGHKSSRTTEIYTHVSNKSIQRIRSPFDDLNIT
jgi:integrase/recombinase XerD